MYRCLLFDTGIFYTTFKEKRLFIKPIFIVMKKPILLGLTVVFMLAALPACKKKGSSGCSEPAIQVTTTPATGTSEAPAPGPDFPLTVNVTSGLPSAGVIIEVKARPETPAGSAPFFTQTSSNVNSASTSYTITNTPSATTCVVEITVTSKSCNTNKWTGSYRYSRK
jgi:hypothetical protein